MHVGFFRTLFGIKNDLPHIDSGFLITEGESLVSRARNNLASRFLQTDFDHLAFIDADIEMKPADFEKLYLLPGVRGAAVNAKRPDFFESLSCFKDGQQVKRSEMPSEAFSVDYLGSAVLIIPRDVFVALIDAEAVSEYTDDSIGTCWDFFPVSVHNSVYESEDYGFCRLCRENDIPITCEPSVSVKHYGSACWDG